MNRRALLLSLLVFFCAAVEAAQSYPTRPIRLVVPFPAGGTSEAIARIVAVQVDSQLAQSIVVDSRGGANGIIGTDIVAHAAPDGYTLLHVTSSFVINPHVYRKLPYDIFKDFTTVTNLVIGTGYLLLASPSVAAQSVPELIALAKSGKRLAYGSPGIGNSLHLATELFNAKAGVSLLHVPFKGLSPAINAALGGEVQVIVMPPTVAVPHVNAGRLRALGFTGKSRLPELPQVPTMKESGVDFELAGGWHGWFAPAGTPPAIVARLHREVQAALEVPKIRDFIVTGGYNPDGRSPAESARFLKSEYQRYGEMAREAGVKPR